MSLLLHFMLHFVWKISDKHLFSPLSKRGDLFLALMAFSFNTSFFNIYIEFILAVMISMRRLNQHANLEKAYSAVECSLLIY